MSEWLDIALERIAEEGECAPEDMIAGFNSAS